MQIGYLILANPVITIRELPFFAQKLTALRGVERYMAELKRINMSGDICFETGQNYSFYKSLPGEKSLSTIEACDVIPGRHIHTCIVLL